MSVTDGRAAFRARHTRDRAAADADTAPDPGTAPGAPSAPSGQSGSTEAYDTPSDPQTLVAMALLADAGDARAKAAMRQWHTDADTAEAGDPQQPGTATAKGSLSAGRDMFASRHPNGGHPRGLAAGAAMFRGNPDDGPAAA